MTIPDFKITVVSTLFLLAVFSTAVTAQTPNEKELIVAQDAAWPPFAFLDENDQPKGLLVDLWRTYAKTTGREVSFKLVDWQEGLDLVKEGKADIHGGLFYSDDRDEYLDFSGDLFPLKTRFFVFQDFDVGGLEDMGNVPVGVTAGGFEEEFIRENYPAVRLNTFPNNKRMVQAAVDGEILAFAADYPVGMYYLNQFRVPEQFRVEQTLYANYLKAAVAEGNEVLLQEISEGLARIPPSEYERIRQKWILGVDVEVLPRWLTAASLGALIAIIIIVLLGYTWILKREVKKRTAELEKANQQLEKVAETDRLTGLFNRGKLDDILMAELKRTVRHERLLAVIMMDIDHFKRLNDTFGHQAGDAVLIAVAKALRLELRASDSLGRWGGEEFLVICPETDLQGAQALADKLRAQLTRVQLEGIGGVTASFGVAAFRPTDGADSLLRRADDALYRAKDAGRNKVILEEGKDKPTALSKQDDCPIFR